MRSDNTILADYDGTLTQTAPAPATRGRLALEVQLDIRKHLKDINKVLDDALVELKRIQ